MEHFKTIQIVVAGKPVALERARHTKTGHIYTPAKTKNWKYETGLLANRAMKPRAPYAGCVELTVKAYFLIPKSWPQWKYDAAIFNKIRPSSKPDLDNIVKIVKDALNGIVWVDDAQVVRLIAGKYFAGTRVNHNPKARVEIYVSSLEGVLPSNITKRPDDG